MTRSDPFSHIPLYAFFSQAFDAHARELVAGMFSVYMTGGFTYIARDLIVRVFYAIGEII